MKPIRLAVKRAVRTLVRVAHDRRGATALEYGLILAFMVVALIVGLTSLGGSTAAMWGYVNTTVATAR